MRITPLEAWIARQIDTTGKPLQREQIEACQLQKLRQTIRWARLRSPFYRERLANLRGDNLRALSDLQRFPCTTADDIQQDPLRFLCVSQSEVQRVVTLHTSGTSGAPKRIFFTAADQERIIDYFHHGISTMAGPGTRVLILLPGEHPGSAGELLATAVRRLGAQGIIHGPVSNVRKTLEVMAQEEIEVLVGLPVQILSLARHSLGEPAPHSVILCSDHAPEAIRREVSRLWNCEIYTHYGTTEMGLGGGLECQANSGYHLRELDLYLEIIEPHTGKPVEDGNMGEVVFTTLSRRGMPLIRYRTGDLSRFLPKSCPCGTVLKTLAAVRSRLAGQIELGRAVLTMADLDEALFPLEGLLDFEAALQWTGTREQLYLKVHAGKYRAENLCEAVKEAVLTIPTVRSGLDQGWLSLLIELQPIGAPRAGGTAKRAIADDRYLCRSDYCAKI
jgi:phenylacetate-coenzyme A ligase PaaK-like adenylate-forming protein